MIFDAPPAEIDIDETLRCYGPVFARERTQRPHAGQAGRHRDAEAVVVVAVPVGLAHADTEGHGRAWSGTAKKAADPDPLFKYVR